LGDWVTVSGYTSGAVSFTRDTLNQVIYAGGDNGTIYRCIASTGCVNSTDWTVSYATPTTSIESLVFDPVNNVLYAGSGSNAIIYRCATSTGCTISANWTTAYDTPGTAIESIVLDSVNNVLYANSRYNFGGGSIIYRCPTSTGCGSSINWTPTFNGTASNNSLWDLAYDSANHVLYGAGFDFSFASIVEM